MPLLLSKEEEGQLSKLMPSPSLPAGVREINKRIITYLIVKLCYSDTSTSLVRLCDVMDEFIDPIHRPTCVQQIRNGKCTVVNKVGKALISLQEFFKTHPIPSSMWHSFMYSVPQNFDNGNL